MDPPRGSTVHVAYVDPNPASDVVPALSSEGFAVDHVPATDVVDDRLDAFDCLVVAHGGDHGDGFAVLEAVEASSSDVAVVFLSDADVARPALDSGAADVVNGSPEDPPVALLAHRIHAAAVTTAGDATTDGNTTTDGDASPSNASDGAHPDERERIRGPVRGRGGGRDGDVDWDGDRDTLAVAHRVTRALVSAADRETVCAAVADGLWERGDVSAVDVFLADGDRAVLGSSRGSRPDADTATLATTALEALDRGTVLVREDLATVEGGGADGSVAGIAFYPMGDSGVLAVAGEDGPPGEGTSALAERVAAVGGRALARLDRRRALTARVLDALPDVFYVLDPDGSFRRWNEELPAATVYDETELDSLALPDVVAESDRDAIRTAIERAREEGGTETREAAIVTAVGDEASYEFTITPLTDGAGEVDALIGTAREVTDRKLLEQRLTVLARVLRHNVRNQMNVIQGRAEYLAHHAGPGYDVAAIDRAAEELVELSNKARRVEAALRESSASQRAIDVSAVAETTLAALTREFPDAELSLETPDTLQAHTNEGLTFVIEELVRNGIVHNDGETPHVRVRVEREPAADGREDDTVAITVADDGPGIPDTEEVAVEAGYETDLDHATGLGLWLVNWVTTAAGGSLSYDDSDLGGTAVTLRFPVAE